MRIGFRPTDFTQVNYEVNRVLVARAAAPRSATRRARRRPLCGLGNFSLPLARRGAAVVGFEGNRELVERARDNASANRVVAQFEVADLFKTGIGAFGPFAKILLDLPREGAIELVKALPADWPRRMVYVSCDPATLRATPPCWFRPKVFASRRWGWSTCSRTPHTWRASPSSSVDAPRAAHPAFLRARGERCRRVGAERIAVQSLQCQGNGLLVMGARVHHRGPDGAVEAPVVQIADASGNAYRPPGVGFPAAGWSHLKAGDLGVVQFRFPVHSASGALEWSSAISAHSPSRATRAKRFSGRSR